MFRRGAGVAMIIALALSLTCCGKMTSQKQGQRAPSGDASPPPHKQVAVMNDGTAAEVPKSQEAERVYAFSYQGDMDRPVYPTLIGSSQKAMDEFIAVHAKDPLLPHGLQVFTTADGLACIGEALKEAEAKFESDKVANPELKESHPLLMVSDWSASAQQKVPFSAASGRSLLRSAEACLKNSDAKPAGSLDALIVLLSR